MKMQEPLIPMRYPISTLFAADSLVSLFRLLEDEAGLRMPEEPCSLKLPALPPSKDLSICSLKTFPDSYRMTKAGRLRPSSWRFLTWGTMSHGRCLTARILESPNPEKGCILSDFLEINAPAKYYLSEKQMARILSDLSPDVRATVSIHPMESPSPSQAAREDSEEKQESMRTKGQAD